LAPLARDDHNATVEGLRGALAESDVLVTVGGVSVGDHDVVRPALEAAGVTLSFYKVRIKPGKPLVFGQLDEIRVLGLPGNPASALVTFTLFGVPLLRALQGDRRPLLRELVLELGAPLSHKPGRRSYYRARIEGHRVLPLENQASGAPTGMAWADALIVAPDDHASFAVGDAVTVLPLEP
jgi:molybdopterin molybdotransferase